MQSLDDIRGRGVGGPVLVAVVMLVSVVVSGVGVSTTSGGLSSCECSRNTCGRGLQPLEEGIQLGNL